DKTLEMLESIEIDCIKELLDLAKAVGKPDKIQLEDIHHLIRRDAKKFARVKERFSSSLRLPLPLSSSISPSFYSLTADST
ncbi:hypothetical protein PENTCL1PPCAC_7966, partial [Pristionchus entomophagus]